MKADIIAHALRLGAGSVRVVPAGADAETAERLRAAFARGDFETWPYDEAYAARAADPSALLLDARSVICVAIPYGAPRPRWAPSRGMVSNYAWFGDYHTKVRRLLRELAAFIDERAGGPATAVICDTAALAERAFAARSGLGWVGKHTNLIAPQLGSYVFLGEIVTTLDLSADAPLRKTCGACRRCVDVCPTQALRGDYTIDAARCISDLTQRVDGIPRELRALVGLWVWGCDLCQEICPPTRRAGIATAESPAPENAAPSLFAMLSMRSGAYKRVFRPTAMGWRGAAVLRRNAAVALGNTLDRAAVPALERALTEDPHPMVREHVAWALGRIRSPRCLQALAARLDAEPDHSVRREIAHCLEPLDPNGALEQVS